MKRSCGYASLVVFALSVVVHFSTYIPSIQISMYFIWPLHLATLGLFAIMMISLAKRQPRQAKSSSKGMLARWRYANRQGREYWLNILAIVPRPLLLACVATFIYAAWNFGLFVKLMEDGMPVADKGKYYLSDHGRKTRDLSEDEYLRFRAYEVRGFSGHWMIFSLMPTVYFLAVRPKLQQLNDQESEVSPMLVE